MGKKLSALLMLSLFLWGCVGPRSPYNYTRQEKVTSHSHVGQVRDVLVDDNIIHYHVEEVSDVVEVHSTLFMPKSIFISFLIPEGTYQKTGEDADRIFFKPTSLRGEKATADDRTVTDIVYLKDDNALTISIDDDIIMRSFNAGFTLKKNARIKQRGEDEEMRSLSYGGSHQKLVSFEYREGENKQRITHNMENGSIFSYEGAQVEIIAYDAHSLKCKVLKGFDVFR